MAEHRLSVCRLLWRLQERIDDLYARIALHDALPRAVIDDMDCGPESWIHIRRGYVEQPQRLEDYLRVIIRREWPQAPSEALHPQA
jgi:hypothetical protein